MTPKTLIKSLAVVLSLSALSGCGSTALSGASLSRLLAVDGTEATAEAATTADGTTAAPKDCGKGGEGGKAGGRAKPAAAPAADAATPAAAQ